MNQCALKPFNQSVSPVSTSGTMSQGKPVSSSSHSSLASQIASPVASPSLQVTNPSNTHVGLVARLGTSPSPSLSSIASPRVVIGGRSPCRSPTRPVLENSPNQQASRMLFSLHSASYYHMQHKHRQSTYGSQTTLSSKGQQRWSQVTVSSNGNDQEGVLVFAMSMENIVAEEETTEDQQSKSELSLKAPTGTGVHKISLTKTAVLCQILEKNEEDLRTYKSSEVMKSLCKKKFLKPTKKGYSWHCRIPIDVSGTRKGVMVRLFLLPAVTDRVTLLKKAILQINVTVKPSLLARLSESGEDSWVMVESEIRDQQAGKKHGETNFKPHAIDPKDGRISFCQDLVMCEKVISCVSKCVNLAIKVTFVTSAE